MVAPEERGKVSFDDFLIKFKEESAEQEKKDTEAAKVSSHDTWLMAMGMFESHRKQAKK